MSIPKPPCDPRCSRRSPVCHDRETCPDWALYQDALTAYNEAVRTAKRGEVDYTSARKGHMGEDVLLRRKKWK